MLESHDRRTILAVAGALAVGPIAGCLGDDEGSDVLGDPEYVEGRPDPGGTSMDDLPDLEGELTIYSGRSQTRVGELLEYIEDRYDDLALEVRYDDTADLVSTIEAEAETPADVFYGSESQSMTHLEEEGYLATLPEEVLESVSEDSRDPDGHWVGFTRRFRAIGYDSERFDAEELPDSIDDYATDDRFHGDVMWAPDQGSFQAFVSVFRELGGEGATREWLRTMVDEQNVQTSPGGDSAMAQAVADGEVGIALTNHYVLRDHPDSTLDLAFTSDDAGAMFNVTGGAVLADSDRGEAAANFVAHLTAAEAQEYFATTTWEYPTVDGVDPLEQLPSTDEFEPPSFDLAGLVDLEPTLDLLREEGIL
ncbi:extracellular solute-binding protein [Natrononativus amylolyticus]|uniref:extracellular solute-binding protein n=1 Tax=Natrononativus amylolyticus TaxID=2963434 RepID=UPI0020CF05FF|nr:extracellular solute-binding protein [Natrononativus amylolyticus]